MITHAVQCVCFGKEVLTAEIPEFFLGFVILMSYPHPDTWHSMNSVWSSNMVMTIQGMRRFVVLFYVTVGKKNQL